MQTLYGNSRKIQPNIKRWHMLLSTKYHKTILILQLLTMASKFSLPHHTIRAFKDLRRDIDNITFTAVYLSVSLLVETDASKCTIAALLRQSDQSITPSNWKRSIYYCQGTKKMATLPDWVPFQFFYQPEFDLVSVQLQNNEQNKKMWK